MIQVIFDKGFMQDFIVGWGISLKSIDTTEYGSHDSCAGGVKEFV